MKNTLLMFTGQNELEIREEPVTDPGPGQILVEARWTLISTGTEMICFQRKFAQGTHWDGWVKYPFSPGYSFAGRVAAVGEGVLSLKEGDRVALRSPHRKYVTVNADQALPIPDGVSDEDATWFGLATITQNGVRRAHHELGDTVVIIGMGILGQLVTQYVRLMGAQEVIAVDVAEPRLKMASDHGATLALSKPVEEVREAVLEATGGRLADVVYDVTGHPKVFPNALGLARKFGKVILLGDTGEPSEQRLTSDVVTRGIQIIGAHDGNPPAAPHDENVWTRRNMALLFFRYLERGQMRVGDMVTHRYAPSQAEEAYGMLAHDRMNAMGVLFDWSKT